MNLLVVISAIVVLFALRFTKLNILGWVIAWWLGLWVILKYGIDPPLPASIIGMFMSIITIALLAYLSASTDYLQTAKDGIFTFLTDKKYTIPLILFVLGVPSLVAYNIYANATKTPQPPIQGRTIHPPPPVEITFKGKKINLTEDDNPFRPLKESDPAAFGKHVQNGRKIYYQNCVFCHGDNMEGDGIFAHAFDPIPANFQDPTTIAMLQEAYLFWRIAKGGPGLPEESTPWASAMPAWEKFLDEDEIWDVILFMYEFTGQKPRAKEEAH